MNPNMPYGQQMPMQPHQRRHDIPYGQMPPHMRPHPAFQQYYQQPVGPIMPQYPQHYPQAWYPYQHHMPPHHAHRHQYYQQAPMPLPAHQMSQQHGPIFVPSQSQSHSSPHHLPAHVASYGAAQPSGTPSTTSTSQLKTPPSRSLSVASGINTKKDATPPTTSASVVPEAARILSADLTALKEPFLPPDQPFPSRAPRVRRRVLRSALGTDPITFPLEPQTLALPAEELTHDNATRSDISIPTPTHTSTPLRSDAPSESASTQPTTPLSTAIPSQVPDQITPTLPKSVRAAIPVVPVVPVLVPGSIAPRTKADIATSATSKPEDKMVRDQAAVTQSGAEHEGPENTTVLDTAIPPPPPSSWAALLRNKNAANTSSSQATASNFVNGLSAPRSETLGDVLNEIDVNQDAAKVSFLKPRGLVNTGNMCYMNSVLQMLVFCTPFYEFLDKVAQRAPHTFKSDTPLIDAMIMFMREYPIIDSTSSVKQLRMRLKPDDYERYGDSFTPEYVYDVIKQLPRFRDMQRGHQQDAQEFLGFCLEELHEECAHAMRSGMSANQGRRSTPTGQTSELLEPVDPDNGWMEVGHKQKAAVTRSSGAIATESPVTSIFGGKLRSELKVSGNKMSVTLEPYQPLQLDIGSPQVNNIVDALKGLTRPESMQGDFQSARGLKTSATKQVFIETLPPVLILHLKRFHYDSTTQRVEKIWKKVGYPLELEMPKEVFPASTRNKYAAHGGLPKYRLIGVIYHHGKNASGGHYTVDIRRQDGQEWIRIDDTVIRRVRREDVAEGGSEEDPKALAAALESHKQGKTTSNRFEQIDGDDQNDDTIKAWSHVNGHSRSKSTMSTVVNGMSTPAHDSSGPQTPRERYSVKDNKVAYLLFYQSIST